MAKGQEWATRIREEVQKSIIGQDEVIERLLVALLANGHVLLEGLPGLAKTLLIKSLGAAMGLEFERIQFTPDLLPSDVVGTMVFQPKEGTFRVHQGPVFANLVLADEINRAPAKVQSALLEAMAERQVTVDNQRFPLSRQFFVIATQNPVDQHGTYPLPEAQLDRFAMKLSVGYPEHADELQMLQDAVGGMDQAVDQHPVLDASTLSSIQSQVAALSVARNVQDYLVRLGHETRSHSSIALGLSPRGLLTWQRVAQSYAWLAGRNFVTPDDVQDVAHPVLSVRLGLEPAEAQTVIEEILSRVAVPNYQE